jgi:signal transduction histidine kinase/DNA-binding response OmpR family regulator
MRFLGLRRLPDYRLVPALCVTATVCIALLCGVVLWQDRREATEAAEQAAGNLAAVAADAIGRTIGSYDLSLQAVTHRVDMPGLWDLPSELRQMVLFDRSAAALQFGFLNVLNETGDVVADMQAAAPKPANFGTRDYFYALKRDPGDPLFVGRPVLTAPGQPAMISLARRRSRPDGSFAGVVVGSMRLAYVQQVFAPLSLGPHGSVTLMRSDGVIMMRLPFDPDDIGRTLPGSAPLFEVLASGRTPIDAIDPDRIARISAFHRVTDLPLLVSVGLAHKSIYAAWWQKAAILATALLALCGLDAVLIRMFRRSDADRARAEAGARYAEAEMSRVVTTASHELRTPLTSVIGYAEMLADTPGLGAEQAGQVATLAMSARHMLTVINRVIEYTRPDFVITALKPAPVELDLLVARCADIVKLNAVQAGLDLICRVDPTLPGFVMLDDDSVRRVVVNLLSNAVKYTERGSVTLSVTGQTTRLRFEVADTGPGIPVGKRDRLFRAWDRLDTDRNVDGSGLGLSISARLVRRMNGEIGYRDNPGGGSVFWFELPTLPADGPAVSPASPASPPVAPMRILLADDEATNLEIAARVLTRGGHLVTTATNGAEAVHRATDADFDVIITDLRMPGMDGLEVARQIRGLTAPRRDTPILLLTADMEVKRLPGYADAKIRLVVPKPFDPPDLLEAVASVQRPEAIKQPVGAQEAHARAPSLFDEAVLDELRPTLGADNVEAHLRALSDRICALLAQLRDPEKANEETLSSLVHDTAGTAGQLGFRTLSQEAKAYEQLDPEDRVYAEDQLRGVAEESLAVLRRFLPPDPPA